jgi:hypothetical protein
LPPQPQQFSDPEPGGERQGVERFQPVSLVRECAQEPPGLFPRQRRDLGASRSPLLVYNDVWDGFEGFLVKASKPEAAQTMISYPKTWQNTARIARKVLICRYFTRSVLSSVIAR